MAGEAAGPVAPRSALPGVRPGPDRATMLTRFLRALTLLAECTGTVYS